MLKIADIIDKVHCCDCLEFMRQMPDKCVDFCFADPPYGINKADWDAEYPVGFEAELLRLSRNGAAITPGQENIATAILAFGDDYKGVLVARNLNGMTFNKIGFGNWIPVILGGKIKRGQDFFEFIIRDKKPDHPSPKPKQFMQKIIKRFTKENWLIFDPFAGSGTTCLVAWDLRRHYIGCEISKDYCKIAEQRIATEKEKYGLFNEENKTIF